jgi:hypothetical protein
MPQETKHNNCMKINRTGNIINKYGKLTTLSTIKQRCQFEYISILHKKNVIRINGANKSCQIEMS